MNHRSPPGHAGALRYFFRFAGARLEARSQGKCDSWMGTACRQFLSFNIAAVERAHLEHSHALYWDVFQKSPQYSMLLEIHAFFGQIQFKKLSKDGPFSQFDLLLAIICFWRFDGLQWLNALQRSRPLTTSEQSLNGLISSALKIKSVWVARLAKNTVRPRQALQEESTKLETQAE
jgi:hypothetical protein